MGRAPCCVKEGLKKGPWTLDEDHKLTSYIAQHGHGSWRALPAKAGLLRCGKSCRLRWNNYLRPDIKRGQFSPSEDQTILQLHAMLGNRWAAIASHLPMRTDNEIKNYWNTQLKKRLIKMGVDLATHKPKTSLQDEKYTGNSTALLSHITQWETARVEAEARLAKESHMRAKGIWPPSSIKRDISTPDVSSSSRNICVSTQSSDLLSDSDAADHLGKWAPCPEIDASELINDFQTWEKSLQGQAGRISTDSSKLSGRSCSSSPLVDRITDTSSFSCIVPRRSWTDIMSYLPLQTNSTNFILTPPSPLNTDQVDDLGQSTSDAVPFQDMVFALSVDDSTFENSVPWSPISEGPVDMDVYERYLDSIPSLVSATTSSNVLDEIDLVSEDISSSKNSSVDFGGISSESLLALSILLDEQPCESQLQSTDHNALDLSREFSEDWSNILMQLE